MLNKKAIAATAAGVETDEDFNQTVLLLHGDGTNGAQNNTFTDSSTNNFTITRNGNTTQGTFSPFSQTGWSNYFDGTGDYLTFTQKTFASDFTAECWVYKTATDGDGYTVVFGDSTQNTQLTFDNSTAGAIGMVIAGSVVLNNAGTAVVANQWNHLAWVRQGSTCRMYVNGVQQGSGSNSSSMDLSVIGRFGSSGGYEMNGYISNARLTNACLYPDGTTFTPSTTPLTTSVSTGTVQLLTCQSNRFVDNSASPATITAFGNTSVQAFSPFAPTAAYSADTNGGSGYFDGSGDYLSLASDSAWALGTGDFTVSCWVYFNDHSRQQIVGNLTTSSNTTWALYIQDGGLAFSNWSFSPVVTYDANAFAMKQWNWIEVSRVSGTYYLFINGVEIDNGTASPAQDYSSTTGIIIGDDVNWSGAGPLNGYLCDLRIVKGSGITSSTVPTSPISAITNTQLLCKFQNAGIIDSTAKNVLETVGNAQIDTGTKKFGTGSIEFDGNGDYLVLPKNVDLSFGTGDFTIEGWVYSATATNATYQCIFSIGAPVQMFLKSGTIESYFDNDDSGSGYMVNQLLGPASSISNSTWAHFAIVRNGSTFTCYVNGTAGTPITSITGSVFYSATAPYVGTYGPSTSSYPFNGYIDDLRITKGVARYTANFTAPTKAFSDQ